MESTKITNGHRGKSDEVDVKPLPEAPATLGRGVNPLDYPACLSHPLYASDEPEAQEHVPFTFFLVEFLLPRVAVKLGVRHGDVHAAFCQAVKQLNLPAACYVVAEQDAGPPATRLKRHLASRYGSFSTWVEGPPEAALARFAPGQIDLLHVEAADPEALRRAFPDWLTRMSGRGVVLVHGTRRPARDGGLQEFWEQVHGAHRHFEFGHGHGLGVLAVGKELPAELLALLAPDADAATPVRQFFFQLGQRLRLEQESRRSGRRLRKLKRLHADARRRYDHLRYQERLQEAINARNAVQLDRLQQSLREQQAENQRVAAQYRHYLQQLQQAQTRLQFIEATAAWKVSNRARDWLVRLFPPASRRARVLQFGRRTVQLWIDEGTRALAAHTYATAKRFVRTRVLRRPVPASVPAPALPPAPPPEEFTLQVETPYFHLRPEVYGVVNVVGWALADSGIESVELLLNGQPLGRAAYGGLRSDVGRDHGDRFKDAERSGFKFAWDTRTVGDGNHWLYVRATTKAGTRQEYGGLLSVDNTKPRKDDYERWIELHEERDLIEARVCSADLPVQPLISVVVPLYNSELHFLERAIDSVRNQTYQNWELCLCDDGSKSSRLRELLDRYCHLDRRIRVTYLDTNAGISAATNRALELANGEYVAFLDHDDELAPFALYQVAKAVNADPGLDMIYSDEDKVSVTGKRYDPFFKPDWSPDLLLGCNYLCHLTVLRAEFLRRIGPLRTEFNGSQDYDLVLRATEQANRIVHIPRVLYHWRSVPSSTAADPNVKSGAHDAARRALAEHLKRRGVDAEVRPGNAIGRWRIKYAVPGEPEVAVIIPTGGNTDLLGQCLRGLATRNTYKNFVVYLVDNSKGEAVRESLPDFGRLWPRIEYLDCRHQPFNYSYLNNLAAHHTAAPYLLFLNDDTEPISPDWMEAMLEHAQRPEVGAVGAKLLYSDGTLQHAGVVMGVYGNSGHAFKYLPGQETEPVYFDFPHLVRNCSVVTAACLMVRRDVFWEVGGFEEIHLPVAFQDVDLCLKVGAKGYRNLYTPFASLYHHEAKTKAEKIPHPYEVRYMQQKWHQVIACDPYYNPNLTRLREDYSLSL